MKIALLADSRKNDLLVNFSIAFSRILSRHELISFYSSARLLNEIKGLNVSALTGDYASEIGQLTAQTLYNEIDAVLYLRDVESPYYNELQSLLTACDLNNIPFASNLAACEMLILGIERGDLDWRTLVK